MSAAILSMEAVGLSFGDKRVLDNLTFSVRRGEVFGFLGPSGAGKTSTIKLLTRQLSRDGGRISLLGRPLERATEADYERVASCRTRALCTTACLSPTTWSSMRGCAG